MSSNSYPFAIRLNTNYIPSEDEMSSIQFIINDLKAKVDILAPRIRELEQALQAVLEEQASYLKEMEDYKALLHPIRRVPFDVMSSIFQILLEGCSEAFNSPRYPSTVVSRVCRGWRSTDLNSPSLWSKIYIIIRYYGRSGLRAVGGQPGWVRKIDRLTDATKTWINRSGRTPLAIHVMSDNTGYDLGDSEVDIAIINRHYHSLVEAIVESSPRWKMATFHLELGSHNQTVLELFLHSPTCLDSLEHLGLSVTSFSQIPMAGMPHHIPAIGAEFLSRAVPSLGVLVLAGCVVKSRSNEQGSKLRDLEYYPTSRTPAILTRTDCAQEFLQILRTFPNVENVIFHNLGSRMGIPFTPATLFLPYLKVLTLRGGHCPASLVESLDLPSLRALHVDFRRDSTPGTIDCGLVLLTQKFGTKLDSLTFAPDLVNRSALVAILESLPRLTTLRLIPHGEKSHFHSHSRSASNPGVDCYAITELNTNLQHCPSLRKLTLETSKEQYSDDAVERTLLDFICMRRSHWGCRSGGGGILEEVCIGSSMLRSRLDLPKELKDRGVDMGNLKILFTYRSPVGLGYYRP